MIDSFHLKKSEHLECNVLKHPVEIKVSGGHPIKFPQNIDKWFWRKSK